MPPLLLFLDSADLSQYTATAWHPTSCGDVTLLTTQQPVHFVSLDLEIDNQYAMLQKMNADVAHYLYIALL